MHRYYFRSGSKNYGACTFTVNGYTTRYRAAKITASKIGQFVTLWRQKKNGPIEPFDIADDIDLILIGTRSKARLGQFVFPISVLFKKQIVSGKNKTGKIGSRIYSPRYVATNRQAKKTQQWQLPYFFKIASLMLTDLTLAKKLYAPELIKQGDLFINNSRLMANHCRLFGWQRPSRI